MTGAAADIVFSKKGSIRVNNFQTAVYLTYNHEIGENSKIIPYLGGYYSYLRTSVRENFEFSDELYVYDSDDISDRPKNNFGMLFGLQITNSENPHIRVEARVFAETAVTISAGYKF